MFLTAVVLTGAAYQGLAMAPSPGLVVAAYLPFAAAYTSVTLGVVLHPRQLAVGCAAANSLNQVGGFVGPCLRDISRNATGSFDAGLSACAVAMMIAAVLILVLRAQVAGRGRGSSRSP